MAKKSEDQGPAKASKDAKDVKRALKASERQVASLRETVDRLEERLERTSGKLERWRTEAKQGRTRIAKLEARLRRARRSAPVDHLPPAERGDLPVEPDVVDASWTVVRLRVAAREQGVVGCSRMTKAQLLAALGA